MEFFIAKKFSHADFSDMDAKVREELKKEGFGVITEIDIKKNPEGKDRCRFQELYHYWRMQSGFCI